MRLFELLVIVLIVSGAIGCEVTPSAATAVESRPRQVPLSPDVMIEYWTGGGVAGTVDKAIIITSAQHVDEKEWMFASSPSTRVIHISPDVALRLEAELARVDFWNLPAGPGELSDQFVTEMTAAEGKDKRRICRVQDRREENPLLAGLMQRLSEISGEPSP